MVDKAFFLILLEVPLNEAVVAGEMCTLLEPQALVAQVVVVRGLMLDQQAAQES